MIKLSQFACDPTAIEEGVDVEIYRGWKWKIRSAYSRTVRDGQAECRRTVLELPKELSAAERDQKSQRIVVQHYAQHVVLGWDDAEDEGKPLVFSPEACAKILLDPRFPDLFDLLAARVANLENFRLKAEEEQKND